MAGASSCSVASGVASHSADSAEASTGTEPAVIAGAAEEEPRSCGAWPYRRGPTAFTSRKRRPFDIWRRFIRCTSTPEVARIDRAGRTDGSISPATMIRRGPGPTAGGIESRNCAQPARKPSGPDGYSAARSDQDSDATTARRDSDVMRVSESRSFRISTETICPVTSSAVKRGVSSPTCPVMSRHVTGNSGRDTICRTCWQIASTRSGPRSCDTGYPN